MNFVPKYTQNPTQIVSPTAISRALEMEKEICEVKSSFSYKHQAKRKTTAIQEAKSNPNQKAGKKQKRPVINPNRNNLNCNDLSLNAKNNTQLVSPKPFIRPDAPPNTPQQLLPATYYLLPQFPIVNSQFSILKAGAMLYTVAICLLVAMLLSSMILLYSYTKLSSNLIYYKELAQDNLESGKNLILYGKNASFGSFSGSLFDSSIDSYYVEIKPWGMYGILHSTGTHGPARASESILFGEIPEGAFLASLYLEDRNRPLNLAGNTELEGLMYLPEAGLRRGIVGKTGFQGAMLHHGAQRLSGKQACEVDYARCTDVRDRLQSLKATQITGNWSGQPGDSIRGEWLSPTIELRSRSPIYLKDIALSGNIVLTASEVFIAEDAQIEDILIFAHKIHVQEGFEGRLQMFATDSITLEPRCKLGYPSTVVLTSTDELGAIVIGEESLIEGLLCADATLMETKAKNQSYTLIASKAEVVGTVIVPENLDIKGTVTGTVRTGKFRLVTTGSLYENYLLDATIQRQGLSPQYAMPLLQAGHPQYTEILTLPHQ